MVKMREAFPPPLRWYYTTDRWPVWGFWALKEHLMSSSSWDHIPTWPGNIKFVYTHCKDWDGNVPPKTISQKIGEKKIHSAPQLLSNYGDTGALSRIVISTQSTSSLVVKSDAKTHGMRRSQLSLRISEGHIPPLSHSGHEALIKILVKCTLGLGVLRKRKKVQKNYSVFSDTLQINSYSDCLRHKKMRAIPNLCASSKLIMLASTVLNWPHLLRVLKVNS